MRAVVLIVVTMLMACSAVPDDAFDIDPLLPGERAPRFQATDAFGERYLFDPDARERPAVIIFYRGGWCPKCTLYWRDLHRVEDRLLALDLDVLFLSADSAELLAEAVSSQTDDLGYLLLSDASSEIAQAFGISFTVDDETYEKYREWELVDLEEASGYGHRRLPAPAVFIVDTEGVIKFAYVNPDYSVRLHPDVLLAAAMTMPGYKIERSTTD